MYRCHVQNPRRRCAILGVDKYCPVRVARATNLNLSSGDNLCAIKANVKDASSVTTRKIPDERSGLPVPNLHGRVVAATDDLLFVHAPAPHKPSVGIGVTLEAEHASLTRYSSASTGAQNPATTGFTHARDRRRHVLLVDACYEFRVSFGGGVSVRGRPTVQFFAGRPTFTSDVDQSDVLVG